MSLSNAIGPIRGAYILYPTANSVELDDPSLGPVKGRIFFSVVEQETHDLDSEITDHAVEKGSNITDHVRDVPDKVTLNVFVSNEPIEDFPDGLLGASVQGVPLQLEAEQLFQPGQATVNMLGIPSLPIPTIGLLPVGVGSAVNNALAGTISITTQRTPIKDTRPSSASVLQFSRAGKSIPNDVLQILLKIKDAKTLVSVVTPIEEYEDMVLQTINIPRDAKTGTGLRMSLTFRHLNIASSQIVTAPKIPRAEKKVPQGPMAMPDFLGWTPSAGKQSDLARMFRGRGGGSFAPTQ